MDEMRRELAAVRLRMRVLTLFCVAAAIGVLYGLTGADAIAGNLMTENDAWSIRTKNVAGTLIARITATTGEDITRVKLTSANLQLAAQTTAVSNPVGGTLWFDDNSGVKKFKFHTGYQWVEAGGILDRVSSTVSVVNTTTETSVYSFTVPAN